MPLIVPLAGRCWQVRLLLQSQQAHAHTCTHMHEHTLTHTQTPQITNYMCKHTPICTHMIACAQTPTRSVTSCMQYLHLNYRADTFGQVDGISVRLVLALLQYVTCSSLHAQKEVTSLSLLHKLCENVSFSSHSLPVIYTSQYLHLYLFSDVNRLLMRCSG